MKRLKLTIFLLGPLCWLTACFQGDGGRLQDGANDAAGTADPAIAREVTGMWLLSTDYNYDMRCNYLPLEYIRSLYKLNESVALEKLDIPNGCEVHWDGQKVGFYFEPGSPYESTFQSEYAFDKLLQPRRVAALDSMSENPGVKHGSYHGPNPQGTGVERPAQGLPGAGVDASAANDSSTQPIPNLTQAAQRIAAPAQNTPTGVAVAGVGDKAIWDPGKRTLHVLHLNHIMHVTAPKSGNEQTARQGAMALANAIIGRLFNKEA